jgi:hypothetical protein
MDLTIAPVDETAVGPYGLCTQAKVRVRASPPVVARVHTYSGGNFGEQA